MQFDDANLQYRKINYSSQPPSNFMKSPVKTSSMLATNDYLNGPIYDAQRFYSSKSCHTFSDFSGGLFPAFVEAPMSLKNLIQLYASLGMVLTAVAPSLYDLVYYVKCG